MSKITPPQDMSHLIRFVRGQRVMLDSDLAELYGVLTKNLNKAVQRNKDRFPDDFMFQLTKEETQNLRCQIGTSSSSYGGRRYLPYVFTQEGVAMLSGVLKSQRAIQMNVAIMRAFVRLRYMTLSIEQLHRKVDALERGFKDQNQNIDVIFKAIRQLMTPPPDKPKRRIGFHP